MYQSNTIRQCLWLITTIRQNERLTLKALQEKWTADKMGDTLYRSTANYLRTLPLHHSQRVADATDDYTDFMLDIRPTPDFIGELLKYDRGLEVLSPPELRLKICKTIEEMLNRY
jgi:hypothetical protein